MILIIAEKPSLARNIAAGIGKLERKNGYLEGCGYIVTWAFGHLFSLCDIEDYSFSEEKSTRWTLDNLPCFPENFRYKLRTDSTRSDGDDGVRRQFEIIKSLCLRDDVDTIVNAGDADREGEIIVRLCIENAGVTGKNLKRLWLPDQTPETVAAALRDMKDESEYQNLANEGFARTFIDWLYGVNLTRYATLRTGAFLRVGRVIIPIVKAIYDRDMSIKNFVPDIYYAVVSNAETGGEEIELVSKQRFDKKEKAKADALCEKYNAERAVVSEKKKKNDTVAPGKLFSLSKLQNFLGKKYKMPMTESLEILQKLYENGYVTYPRTNSEYLATAEKDKMKAILKNIKDIGYPVIFKDGKNIFDDSKIESHSALTPTYKIPKKTDLNENEYKVYSAVLRRFVAVFCSEKCVAEKTEIVIDLGGIEQFSLKGTVIIEKGWTKYDDFSQKDKILPRLEVGDAINVDFKPVEKETSAPKHYTIETLNNYLKNPFREEKAAASENEDDAEEYRAIFEGLELGTEATRTGIIDNARNSKYIELKKDVYTVLPGGEFLIESLGRMNISMDKYKTSEMGKALKKVFHGEMTVDDSVKLAQEEIAEVFKKREAPPEKDTDMGFYGDIVGKCPICGRDVIRSRYGYACTGLREKTCDFKIGGVICGRVISLSNAKLLLSTGKTSKIEGFVSKSGKPFDAALKLSDGKAVFDF
ncbi:MAG: topoisomerase C-terminal repeat-containing protein [Clostridia bacterium]|nr:topoisomerase C-terminal repeat-containing protein [Clostridia bacterium]